MDSHTRYSPQRIASSIRLIFFYISQGKRQNNLMRNGLAADQEVGL